GFMAENLEKGLVKQFHWHDIPALREDDSVFLLDTRTPGEYGRGHAEGFANIPVDELRDRIDELPAGKTVCIMCQSGLRSYVACRLLEQRGFECRNFSGGYSFYKAVVLDEQLAEQSFHCGMEK
ncbi:MAG: CoA-disulfide reductase, partial [Oscillospiraceae bacterium]|nr:CoA-disulfide reductase [Oscillospiraceae bacterium]